MLDDDRARSRRRASPTAAPNGDVNYAVRKFPGYGKLSGKSLDELRAGERVAVLDGKDDPLDFVLWKAAKAERARRRASGRARAAPAGPAGTSSARRCAARCSASTFDIHGGGMDLQFPHHENEIAQSEGAQRQAVRPLLDAQRLPATSTTRRCRSRSATSSPSATCCKRYDGETLRFFMLRTHYRSPFNFSDANLDDARSALRRLYTALDGVAAGAPARVDWSAAARRAPSARR